MSEDRDARLLSEHATFVRRVARGILADEDALDEIVQGTFLEALRHPPRRASLRGWLARVARNLAISRWRADRSRRRRELKAVRPGPASGPEEMLVRLETQRRVIDAVMGLDEPYRTAIMLRYFDDLAPAEIAARLGVPLQTVRTRLKRALAQLRARLEGSFGQDRRATLLALLPLAFGGRGRVPLTGATPAGAILMSAKPKLSIAALLLLALGAIPVALVWMGRPADEGAVIARTAGRSAATLPAREDGGARGPASAAAISVDVRVVGPGRLPVAGASVLLFLESAREWPEGFGTIEQAWFQAEWRPASPGPPPILERQTDGDGLARFDVTPGCTLRVEARRAGFSRGSTDLYYLSKAPARPVEIRLSPAHGLAGRVVDFAGRPVPGATVAVGAVDLAARRYVYELPQSVVADGDGGYAFDSLAAGDLSLWAAFPDGMLTCVATLRVPDIGRFDIALEPRGTLRGNVTERGTRRPIEGIEVRAMVGRTSPGFGRGFTDSEGNYEIRDLVPGALTGLYASGAGYALEVRGGEGSWITPQIYALQDTVCDLELVRTGAVHGTVRGPDGILSRLMVEAMSRIRSDYATFQVRTDEQGAYRIAGLPPGDYLVRAATPLLREPGSIDMFFEAFAPGNEASLVAVPSGGEVERSFLLEAGTGTVEGRVEDGEGVGLAGASVSTYGAQGASGPSGEFRLEGCVTGDHVSISAALEGYGMDGIAHVSLNPHETVQGVLLRLRPATKRELRGRVHAVERTSLREPYVLVSRVEEQSPVWRGGDQPARHPVAPDGTFSIDLEESPMALKSVLVRAGDIGAGVSAPVRVEIGEATNYEVELFLTEAHVVKGVILGEAGQPVPFASVSLAPPKAPDLQDRLRNPRAFAPIVAVTDALGRFEARGLAVGNYELRAWAGGMIDAVAGVSVPLAEPLRITLERACELAGRIVSRDGNPVGRIHLWVQLPMPASVSMDEWHRIQSRHGIHNLCTNELGEFRLGGLKKGDYLINVGGGSGGPNVVAKAFEGIPAGATDLRLVMEPGLAMSGRVVNRAGEGIPGVYMAARIEGAGTPGDSRRYDTTAPDGSFEITGLAAGSHSIWMSIRKGRARREITREHFQAGASGIVIEIDDAFLSISGTLSDGLGSPLAGVGLRVRSSGTSSDIRATTDAAGRFVFEGVDGIEYQVRVEGERYAKLLLDGGHSVRGGETGVVLRLHEGATIAGTVRDETGAAVRDVWVEARAGETVQHTQTGPDGIFRITGLPGGAEARLRAVAVDFAWHMRSVRAGTSGVGITLKRGTVSRGRVIDAAGEPLARIRLVFTPVEGEDTESQTRAKDDGTFVVRLLERDYRVTAVRIGEEGTGRPCGVVRGGSAEFELTAE